MATMTLLGLYNYDPTIFDLMSLPAGVDKDLVRDNILLQSTDFEVLYPDPVFVKQAVKRWADKWYFTFEKWVTALAIQYDPLNNYDRYEEYEDTEKEARKDTGSTTEAGNNSATTSNSTTGSSVSGSTTDNNVSAYDSATMREDTQQITNGTVSDTSSGSSTSSANDSRSGTESRDGTTDRTLKHKAHLYGNIGVTTSQQMLESELQIARFNLVDQITDCFINEFCIRVYD